jgi:hypothetical protein
MSENPTPADEQLPPAPAEDDRPFRLLDYIVVDALFLGFLAVLYLLMRVLFPDAAGLYFFFIVLGVGFVSVSIYDFLFDRLSVPPSDGEGERG